MPNDTDHPMVFFGWLLSSSGPFPWFEKEWWDKAYPVPFGLVKCNTEDRYMWGIAMFPIVGDSNHPTEVDSDIWKEGVTEEDIKVVENFCSEHGIKLPGKPTWYLVSGQEEQEPDA